MWRVSFAKAELRGPRGKTFLEEDFVAFWSVLQTSETLTNILYSLAVFVGLQVVYRLLIRFKTIRISSFLAHLTIILASLWFFLSLFQVPLDAFGMKLLKAAALFLAILMLLNLLDRLLIDNFLKAKRKVEIPVLLHELVRIALLILILFVIISKVFQAKLSTLLVSSAVVSAVIGLALQDVLGNIVAGVALHVGKPFKVGDWVQVTDQTGAVVQMSWRATTIRTLDGDFVIIPNGSISKEEIVNYSAPNPRHALYVEVGTRYELAPNMVKDTMVEAALQTWGVLPEPKPRVWVTEYGDFAINYKMKYWIDDFPRHPDIGDQIMTRIWYLFRRRGVGIPFPIRDVNLYTVTPEVQERERNESVTGVQKVLAKVEILSPLSEEERRQLAEGALVQRYAKGEDIVLQGEGGDSFFVLTSGLVEVSTADGAGVRAVLAQLGEGSFFGEMSLLTGEKRTATVTALKDTDVIVIDKANFAQVITNNPAIAKSLSEILERRLAEIAAKMSELEKERPMKKAAVESGSSLLKRIRSFFRL
jgi:small-conductance mechanosensitive channel/CRP-like cAMP-binding protein